MITSIVTKLILVGVVSPSFRFGLHFAHNFGLTWDRLSANCQTILWRSKFWRKGKAKWVPCCFWWDNNDSHTCVCIYTHPYLGTRLITIVYSDKSYKSGTLLYVYVLCISLLPLYSWLLPVLRRTVFLPSFLPGELGGLACLIDASTSNQPSLPLNMLQTIVKVDYSVCFVHCQPCGWHMLMVWNRGVNTDDLFQEWTQ